MGGEIVLNLKSEIRLRAKQVGIDLVGFAAANPLDDLREVLEARQTTGRSTDFEEKNIEMRINSQLSLSNAKTVISVGLGYYHPRPELTSKSITSGKIYGQISRSAWGQDYHKVMGNKLAELSRIICEIAPGSSAIASVDTGPLMDRAFAVTAGLGWSGKNCSVINPEYGSWLFLGQIVTDLELEPDNLLVFGCGECEKCLQACPTGALISANVLDPRRCLSYLTQMKGFVPREYRCLIGTRIYGCDTCQEGCQANNQPKTLGNSAFEPQADLAFPDLVELMQLSNREFKRTFGETAAGWRGRTVLQRNALIALGNLKDKASVECLINALKDHRSVIRGTAAWALAEIGGADHRTYIEEALVNELEPDASYEMRLALK